MQQLVAPHLDSFNYMITEGLDTAIKSIIPMKIIAPNQNSVNIWIDNAEIGFPTVAGTGRDVCIPQILISVALVTHLRSKSCSPVSVANEASHMRLRCI